MSNIYKITVLFFANFREIVGEKQVEIEIPAGSLVKDLKKQIGDLYSGIGKFNTSTLVAINHEFAFDEDPIPDGAEIAFFPPVSGGTDSLLPSMFYITEEAIDLDQLVNTISLPSTGAVGIFTGLVRGNTNKLDGGRETDHLVYEAYKPMAEEKMKQVADEIRIRWPAIEGIAIVQRIGTLYPGTPTVTIACSAGHRDSGVFEAARYGIDRLKEIVPIWKKEVGPGGKEWIEGDYHPGKADRL